jgi:hypothetical protein
MKNKALQFPFDASIKTKILGVLIQCPKRGLPNHVHNLLILQAEHHANGLSEKAYFSGR